MRAVVVIPIYKAQPSFNELGSLLQCLSVLRRHPIAFVCPKGLDVSLYSRLCKSANALHSFERFDDVNFVGVKEYSRLLLRLEFYERFKSYDYMLLYQLDAWVFSDELDYWTRRGYSYIGAPWFEMDAKGDLKIVPFGGNGGFSLRDVSAFNRVLSVPPSKYVAKLSHIWRAYDNYPFWRKLIRLPRMIGRRWASGNRYGVFLESFIAEGRNEDGFFSSYAPMIDQEFIVAPSFAAVPFAFECQPRMLFEMNKRQLPFGCHAWEKYESDFWETYVHVQLARNVISAGYSFK